MAIKKITIAIEESIVNEIDKRAKDAKRSRSNYLECAIEEHLSFERREKQFQDKIAELETEIIILKAVPQQTIIQPTIEKSESAVEEKEMLSKPKNNLNLNNFKGGIN